MIHKCKIKSRSNLIQHDVSGGEAHLTGLWEYVQHKKVVIRCPLMTWTFFRSSSWIHSTTTTQMYNKFQAKKPVCIFVGATQTLCLNSFCCLASCGPARAAENSPLFFIQTTLCIVFLRGGAGPEHHSLSMTLHSAADKWRLLIRSMSPQTWKTETHMPLTNYESNRCTNYNVHQDQGQECKDDEKSD